MKHSAKSAVVAIFICSFVFVSPLYAQSTSGVISQFWNNFTSSVKNIFVKAPASSLKAQVSGVGSSLIAYYTFDEGSGSAAGDSSGSGSNGTLVNGPSWITGKVGSGALSFDGVDDYVSLGKAIFTTSPHSVCAWIKPQLKANGSPQYIVYQAAPMEYGVLESDGSLSANFYNAVDFTGSAWGAVVTDNWQHMCITVSSDRTTKLYVNSSLVNSPTPFANELLYFGNTFIGANANGGGVFKGGIDDVRIYERELSATDVGTLFTLGGGSVPTVNGTCGVASKTYTSSETFPAGSFCSSGSQSVTPSDPAIGGTSNWNCVGSGGGTTASCSATRSVADVTAPTTPGGLFASGITQTRVNITWNASTDAIGVTNYRVYKNGVELAQPTTNAYSATGLVAGTTYSFTVKAEDASGNISAASGALSVTTLAASAPGTKKCNNTATIIDDVCLVPWQPGVTVGVPGGIPTDRVKCTTSQCQAVESAAVGYRNGTTDATTLIQSAINSAAQNTYVSVPAGTWKVSGLGLDYSRDKVTLRGAGMNSTIFDCRGGVCIVVGNGGGIFSLVTTPVISGLYEGSTHITVGNGSTFSVGQTALLQVENDKDPRWPVLAPSDFPYLRKQVVKVTARSGNNLTIFPGLYGEYSGLSAKLSNQLITGSPYQTDFAGLEDFTIDGSNASVQFGLFFAGTNASWVKNVKTRHMANYSVFFNDSLNCEMRDSYLDELNHAGSNGAGLLMNIASGCLIENNIIRESFPNVEVNHGSSGNVFGYNFLNNENGLIGFDTNHGPHNTFNLYEGNIVHNILSDGYFGGEANGTFFRNWVTGVALSNSGGSNIATYILSLKRMARNTSIVGNMFGTSGYVGNDAVVLKPYFENSLGVTLGGEIFDWMMTNNHISTCLLWCNGTPGANYKISNLGAIKTALLGSTYSVYTDQVMEVFHRSFLDFGGPNIGNGFWEGTAQPSKGDWWEDFDPTTWMTAIRGTLVSKTDSQHGTINITAGRVRSGTAIGLSSPGNYPYAIVGTVTGTTATVDTSPWGDKSILPAVGTALVIQAGSGGFQEKDLDVEATTLLKSNWYAAINAVPYTEAITPTLPNSLYLTSKPCWFGSLTWPAFDPNAPAQSYSRIPAAYRYFNGGSDPAGIPVGCASVAGVPYVPVVDTTAPVVSLTSPSAGIISGTVTLGATATDNVGVIGVQFKIDGTNIGGELSVAPYSGSWNTAGVTNGAHTLTVSARDATGNSTVSSPVLITISNTVPPVVTPTPDPVTGVTPPVPTTPASPSGGGTTGTFLPTVAQPASPAGTGSAQTPTPTPIASTGETQVKPTTYIFTKTLSLGMKDAQVVTLQKYLNANGFPIAQTGAGSVGKETTYFGPATKNALIKFQKAKAIVPASGLFGPLTRSFITGVAYVAPAPTPKVVVPKTIAPKAKVVSPTPKPAVKVVAPKPTVTPKPTIKANPTPTPFKDLMDL